MQLSKRIGIFFNTGNDTFGTPTIYPNDLISQSLAVADVNSDNKVDIVVSNSETKNPASIGIFFNTVDSIFTVKTTYETDLNTFFVAIVDMSRDNQSDIMIAHARSLGILYTYCH
jgi:hypothetical protein